MPICTPTNGQILKPALTHTSSKLNTLVRSTPFQVCFFAALAGLFLLFAKNTNLLSGLENELTKAEHLLLDTRLRFKQEVQSPDPRIVLVGKDRNTDAFGRAHPEMGLTGGPLPRDSLADIINYLSQQGAKAIILDTEFKNRTTKEADNKLAEAIRNAGNVYTADDFYEKQHIVPTQGKTKHLQYTLGYLLYAINASYYQTRWLLPIGSVTALPFPTPLLLNLSDPTDPLGAVAVSLDEKSQTTPLQMPLRPYAALKSQANYIKLPNLTEDSYYALQLGSCTEGAMQRKHQDNPYFLERLEALALPIQKKNNPVSPFSLNITRCQAEPVYEPILAGVKGIGVVSVEYFEEGYLRQIPLLYQGYKGHLYGYLGLQPALDLLEPTRMVLKDNLLTVQPKNSLLKLIPIPNTGEILINWKNPERSADALAIEAAQRMKKSPVQVRQSLDTAHWLHGGNIYRVVSAVDILKQVELTRRPERGSEADFANLNSLYLIPNNPNAGLFPFKDKIVFYGDTVKDIHRTPASEAIHGTEVVAAVSDMILNDTHFFQKVDDWRLYSVIGLLMLIMVYRLTRSHASFVAENVLALWIIAGYWVINFYLFRTQALWLPLVIPNILLVGTLTLSDAYRYWVQDKEKRQLTNVFANYVSPQVMEEILKNPDKAMDNLKGTKKELTVIFTDIKNFTTIFENEDPEKMVEQLNEYFDKMIEIILKHDGTIDKFMGDAVMAFFGAPHPQENHAEVACRAAVEMQAALHTLNEKWKVEGKKPLEHGIGLSTGLMFVGNFGSQNNKDFTVMGSVVNLGARLESCTRELDADIIISARTYEVMKERILYKDLGHVSVKGFREPVPIYALEGFIS